MDITDVDEADSVEDDLEAKFFKNLMDIFVWPEVARRQAAGQLPTPFGLERFQILMWADEGRKSQVLLNEEVEIVAHVKLTTPDSIAADGSVPLAAIERVNRISPVNEPNAAHATFFQLNGSYHLVCDFTYNRARATDRLVRAEEFFAGAQSEIDAGRLSTCVELLWSCAELAAIAILLTVPDPDMLTKKGQNHKARREKFEAHGKLNFPAHATLVKTAEAHRAPARYLEGEVPDEAELRGLLEDARGLIQYAHRRLRPIGEPEDEASETASSIVSGVGLSSGVSGAALQ